MKKQIWKGYCKTLGHYVEGNRAYDNGGVWHIIKGDKPIEETPIYNIYPVDGKRIIRIIKSVG